MLVCPFCGREFPGGVEKCPDCLADLFFEATDGRRLDYDEGLLLYRTPDLLGLGYLANLVRERLRA